MIKLENDKRITRKGETVGTWSYGLSYEASLNTNNFTIKASTKKRLIELIRDNVDKRGY